MLNQSYTAENYGSISWGTLLTEDLVDAIASFAGTLDGHGQLKETAQEALEATERGDLETAALILNEELFDLMNEIAPKGTYFGSHMGDGADFAFWSTEMLD